MGRWLACDPLSLKYPGLSPYNFVANNPIIAIDPDGKKIEIVVKVFFGLFKIKRDYSPNMKILSNDKLAKQTKEMLDVVHKSVGEKFEKLMNDPDNVITLIPTKNEIEKNNRGQNWMSDENILVDPSNATMSVKEDGSTYFQSPTTNLSHELGHKYYKFYPEEVVKGRRDNHDQIRPEFETKTAEYINSHYGGREGTSAPTDEPVRGYDYNTSGPLDTAPSQSTDSGKQVEIEYNKTTEKSSKGDPK